MTTFPGEGPGGAADLEKVHRALRSSPRQSTGSPYRVPSVWGNPRSIPSVLTVDPFEYYAHAIASAAGNDRNRETPGAGGEWSRRAVVYNMMIRTSAAFDHDGDGALALPVNAGGWRETGTFLKAIAMIPYIRSLGMNTIHLLPVQRIGTDGRRGNLGSVYAVRDLLAVDDTLSEPNLGLDPGVQFRGFLQAVHHCGMRVILEFPLRTVSKDCVWIEQHPEWFYWIGKGKGFAPPVFSDDLITLAGEKISRGEREGLPAPPLEYISLFTDPPPKSSVRKEGNRLVGTLPGNGRVVVPGAFTDWPPNDQQPVWEDVTYLKYFQDKQFNYMSYNTLRMYDSSLIEGDSASADLWSTLSEVISTYVGTYGIDGVMIDMAHALPDSLTRQIITRARSVNPDVAFWAEDFERTPEQASEGYNAVLGGQWDCLHRPADFHDMLSWISRTPTLPPHLGAPETHNTPRAVTRQGGVRYTAYAWTISNLIPAIPYLHSGFERGESTPVNTGLGFSPDDLKNFPSEKLPLFSAARLDWSGGPGMTDLVRKVAELRDRFMESCAPLAGTHFSLVDTGDPAVLGFRRASPQGREPFLVVGNSDMENSRRFRVPVASGQSILRDLFSEIDFAVSGGHLDGDLLPGQVLFFPEKEGGR